MALQDSSRHHKGAPAESELERALRLSREERLRDYGATSAGMLESTEAIVGADRLKQSAELHRHFDSKPHLRKIWEPLIFSGKLSMGDVLALIGAA